MLLLPRSSSAQGEWHKLRTWRQLPAGELQRAVQQRRRVQRLAAQIRFNAHLSRFDRGFRLADRLKVSLEVC